MAQHKLGGIPRIDSYSLRNIAYLMNRLSEYEDINAAPAFPPPTKSRGHPWGWRSCVGMSADRGGVGGRAFVEGNANFAYRSRALRSRRRWFGRSETKPQSPVLGEVTFHPSVRIISAMIASATSLAFFTQLGVPQYMNLPCLPAVHILLDSTSLMIALTSCS